MKNVIVLLLLIVLISSLSNAQVLTLEHVINSALNNNEKIKQYNEKALQKNYQDMESWGNFLPSVNFEGSYNHLNDPLQFDLGPVRDVIMTIQAKNQAEFANIYNMLQGNGQLSAQQRAALFNQSLSQLNSALPPFVETLKKQDYRTASVVGVQPIFLGGKLLAAKRFSSSEKQASQIELKKIKDEVSQEAVNYYLNVVLLQNIVKTREDVLLGIQKHRDNAEKLLQEGLIANYHLLRAEVAVADAERNLSDDKNRLELAVIALKHTAGLPDESVIIISDTLDFTEFNDSLDTFLTSALMHQPVMQLIEMKKEAASSKYIAERANFFPTLAAFGKYEMLPEYLSSLEPRWVVGLQLKLNLFNGFKDYAKLQTAVHLEREVNYIEADAKRRINLWVNKSYRDVINSRTRYFKLNKTIELAKENLRLNEKRFSSGMGTSLEVIDARLSLEKNSIESLVSLYDYYRSLTDLYTAEGNPEKILTIWNKEQ